MRTTALSIALLLAMSQQALCDFDFLHKGDAAPYEGFLITAEREQSLRLMDQKLDFAAQLNIQYEAQTELDNKTIQILTQRVDNYQKQTSDLEKQLAEVKGDTFLQKTLYFTLGAVLTGFIAYGTVHALK